MCKYKAIKVNGKKYDEHRYIMEQYIGRKLKRNEVVHHKDGNKLNNDIDNLELMTLSEHSKLHQTGVKFSDETKNKMGKSRRKLTDDEVRYIRKNYIPRDKEFGANVLCKRFNIKPTTVKDIASNKIYKDVI